MACPMPPQCVRAISVAVQSYCFVQSGDKELRYKSLHYYGVIFFFILGAGCGALVTQHFGSTTIVYCNILLLLTCALLSIEHVEE